MLQSQNIRLPCQHVIVCNKIKSWLHAFWCHMYSWCSSLSLSLSIYIYIYIYIYVYKYIVEIHTSNIIIEKNHKANIHSTCFIFSILRINQKLLKIEKWNRLSVHLLCDFSLSLSLSLYIYIYIFIYVWPMLY